MPRPSFFVPAFLALAATAPLLRAATINWSGAGDGTTWSSTANWTGGVLPGPSDDVVIPDLPTNPTISFAFSAGTVVVKSLTTNEAFSVSGGSLKATDGLTTSAAFSFSSGTLLNTAITSTGAGSITVTGGTLDGVTINSAATFSNAFYVKNGLTLSGNPKITMAATIYFSGTQTLAGTGEFYLSNTTTSFFDSVGGGSLATASTLTLAPGITIDGPGNAYFSGYYGTDSVINQGSISASASAQTLNFSTGSFTNTGTISLSGSATINLSNAWTNSGTFLISGGTLNLGGTFVGSSLGTFNRSGGTVAITGTVNSSGGALAATATTGNLLLSGGTLNGVTVTTSGGATFAASGGTLDGVTLASPATLSGSINVNNGLTLSSSPKITVAGTLYFRGTQTLGGTGEIYLSNTTTSFLTSLGGGTLVTSATLTIGSGITIDGPGNAYFSGYYGTDAVINQGAVSISNSGQTLNITTGTFTNAGTLSATGGSTINLNNAWSNTGTLVVNASTVNLGGTFSGSSLGTISRTGGTLNITGTVSNSGGNLALTAATGNLKLTSGTLTGVTVTTAGGSVFSASGGTLDNVTIATDAVLSGSINVNNGLTLSGNPTVSTTANLYFYGTQTLGGTGKFNFVSGGTSYMAAVGGGSLANAATLTIGSNISFEGPSNATFAAYYVQDSIVNKGTIAASTSGQVVTFSNGILVNQGTIKALNGTTVNLNANWTNTGTLLVNGGTLNLGGTFTSAALGTFDRTGGSVKITGTVDNTGNTLTATTNTGPLTLTTGTITGGTIATSGSGTFAVTGGNLNGVTIANPISIGGNVNVRNGLTLASNVKVTVGGVLYFYDTQTLGGTGELYLSTGVNNGLYAIGGGTLATAANLTIGPNITVDGPGSASVSAYYDTDSVTNQGTIIASATGQTITMSSGNFTNQGAVKALSGGTVTLNNRWSNAGTFFVNAGTLNLGGNYTTADIGTINRTGGTVVLRGTLTNTGSTLALTAATGDLLFQSGTILGGNITTAGGSKLILGNPTLDGVTLNGNATVTGTPYVKNNLTLAGGKLTLNDGSVYFQGTQTLGGTGEVAFDGASGTLYSVGGGTVDTRATLTVSPTITLTGSNGPRIRSYYSTDKVESFASVVWTSPRLVNISTRAVVGTGADILIPGFVIAGQGNETLLIRAAGPTLGVFGVEGALAVPTLTVFDSKGNAIASNTGWGTSADPAQITAVSAKVGAFGFPAGSADCAIVAILPAGAYTVQVSGVGGTTGVALAEVYEVSSTGTRLTNISTRAQVGTGPNIIIPGFVIRGPGSEKLLVRADGPVLSVFGVTDVLLKPSINFLDSGGHVIATNTGWGTNANPAQVSSAAASIGAFALPAGSDDSALVMTLTEGTYTFQVLGVNLTTGNALAEIYELP